MAKDPKSRKNRRYSVLILLLGLGLIAAGIIGIITSRSDSIAYKNSTDIRKVDAVINAFSTREDESSGLVTETTFKFDVSYVIDGKTYKGRYEVRVKARDLAEMYYYGGLRRDDTISIEVYKTQKGSYKLSPDEGSGDILYYCAAIPVGVVITAVMAVDMIRKKSAKQNADTPAKGG